MQIKNLIRKNTKLSNYLVTTILTLLIGTGSIFSVNPRNHINSNVDVYFEIQPIKDVLINAKKFYFSLVNKERAEEDWAKITKELQKEFGEDMLTEEGWQSYGIDTSSPIGISYRQATVKKRKRKTVKHYFMMVLPATKASALYQKIYRKTKEQSDPAAALSMDGKPVKRKKEVRVKEIKKGEIALLNKREHVYLLKGKNIVIITNDLKTGKRNLAKARSPISADKTIIKILNYNNKNFGNKSTLLTAYIKPTIFSKVLKPSAYKKKRMEGKLTILATDLYKYYKRISFNIKVNESGIKFYELSALNKSSKKLKMSKFHKFYNAKLILSHLDIMTGDPLFYGKLRLNYQYLINYFAKYGIPVRKEFAKVLSQMAGEKTRDEDGKRLKPSKEIMDVTRLLKSNVSVNVLGIPTFKEMDDINKWNAYLSFNYNESKKKAFLSFMKKISKQIEKEKSVSIEKTGSGSIDKWKITLTKIKHVPVKTKEKKGSDDDTQSVEYKKVKEYQYFVIVMDDQDITISTSPSLLKSKLKREGKPYSDRIRKNHPSGEMYAFMYFNIKQVLNKLVESKMGISESGYWAYIENLKDFQGGAYKDKDMIISDFEINLNKK